jgi:DNA processing protein
VNGPAGLAEGGGAERRARVTLSFLAAPGDPVLGAALRTMAASELLAATTGSGAGGEAVLSAISEVPALARAMARWRERLALVPGVAAMAAWQQAGLRLVLPGDQEWPTQLDDLGDARPLLLWVRGSADLRYACLNSVSVVGARAATGYGNHVALEMSAALAGHGLAVVSGGAFGQHGPVGRRCDTGFLQHLRRVELADRRAGSAGTPTRTGEVALVASRIVIR